MFKVIDDKRTEMFFMPIPKWITYYSQIAIVVIFVGIVTGASFVKYPRIINSRVVISSKGSYIVTDFASYRKIDKERSVQIESPARAQPIKVGMELNEVYFRGNFAYIPLIINNADLLGLTVRDSIETTGKVISGETSILSQVFSK